MISRTAAYSCEQTRTAFCHEQFPATLFGAITLTTARVFDNYRLSDTRPTNQNQRNCRFGTLARSLSKCGNDVRCGVLEHHKIFSQSFRDAWFCTGEED